MRPVSAAFQEAVRQPVRQDRIEGYIGLWDSETVFHSWPFNETQIVQGSLSITDQFAGGKFGFGGAYTRNLSIKLDLDKFHENFDRTLINLTDGEIMLFYYLTLADGTEERVFLGQYFIDSEKSSRKFNVLSITAVDGLSKFDTPVKPQTGVSVYEAYYAACFGSDGNYHAVSTPATFFEEVAPNGTMTLTYDNSQIQTNRDLLMWIGELTGTFVRELRDDPPDWDVSPLFTDAPNGRPEMVQIPTKYTKAGTSGNFDLDTFKADNGSIIPADVRFSTKFSDTSIRVTTWNTSCKGKMLTSHTSWEIAPDTLEGTMELSSNPLLNNKSESQVQTALDNIRDYGEDLRFCPFKTTFNGNPAIECGDFVYLEPGGAIDETKYRHYGIVTYYKWRFHGKCEIRCATDAVASYTRPKAAEASTQSTAKKARARAAEAVATTVGASVKAKSQLEKRIDALEGKASAASDRLVASDGSMWVLKDDALCHYTADGTYDCSVNIYNSFKSTAFDVKINLRSENSSDNKNIQFVSDGNGRITAGVGYGNYGISLSTKKSAVPSASFWPTIKFSHGGYNYGNYEQIELLEDRMFFEYANSDEKHRYRVNLTKMS